MYHIVFIEPPDDTHVATEDEAVAWIKFRLPHAAFTPWHGKTKYAYPDERTRDLAETQAGTLVIRCSAYIIDTSQPVAPPTET